MFELASCFSDNQPGSRNVSDFGKQVDGQTKQPFGHQHQIDLRIGAVDIPSGLEIVEKLSR
ncbi:MAG: hypothetical protein A2066_14110 [Bacteroidetes bacterium GWB2_41_8]|nr:MAG: hypothetical protein A2066_14110 [Bacteroidetes bacterium GWB2_41_8]